jgi:hypothetical protein
MDIVGDANGQPAIVSNRLPVVLKQDSAGWWHSKAGGRNPPNWWPKSSLPRLHVDQRGRRVLLGEIPLKCDLRFPQLSF